MTLRGVVGTEMRRSTRLQLPTPEMTAEFAANFYGSSENEALASVAGPTDLEFWSLTASRRLAVRASRFCPAREDSLDALSKKSLCAEINAFDFDAFYKTEAKAQFKEVLFDLEALNAHKATLAELKNTLNSTNLSQTVESSQNIHAFFEKLRQNDQFQSSQAPAQTRYTYKIKKSPFRKSTPVPTGVDRGRTKECLVSVPSGGGGGPTGVGGGGGGPYGNGSSGAGGGPLQIVFLIFFWFCCSVTLLHAYRFCCKRLEKALLNLQNYLNTKDSNKRRIAKFYSFLFKCLVGFAAMFAGPELFFSTIATLNPRLQPLLRVARFLFRYGIVISLFLNVSSSVLQLLKGLGLEPVIKLPAWVDFPRLQAKATGVYFLQKCIQISMLSILFGSCSALVRLNGHSNGHSNGHLNRQRLKNVVFVLMSCGFATYFVFISGDVIRMFCWKLVKIPAINTLVYCVAGRFILLLGNLLLMRSRNLQGSSIIYVILAYAFGVYRLAFSSNNLLPL